MSKRRKKLVQNHAKKLFTATASAKNTRPINLQPTVMRGGYRL